MPARKPGQHLPKPRRLAMASVKGIPPGYTTVTPSITVKDTPKVIEFYKKAFGATERARMAGSTGKTTQSVTPTGYSILMKKDKLLRPRTALPIRWTPPDI